MKRFRLFQITKWWTEFFFDINYTFLPLPAGRAPYLYHPHPAFTKKNFMPLHTCCHFDTWCKWCATEPPITFYLFNNFILPFDNIIERLIPLMWEIIGKELYDSPQPI